ncbi:YqkE family protein [Metabacillus herbersteinensis]|uniref:YqkE family protein n=1 Tax=Metabacillus herbersteinensis TaxID=283816 RepID=A0ABV6GCV7_9BACI
MKKQKKKKDESSVQLGDHLNTDLLEKLKSVKKGLTEEQEAKEEAAKQQKIIERKEREKNKSFEELLNESALTWKDYK